MIRRSDTRLIVFIWGVIHFLTGLGLFLFPDISKITSLHYFTGFMHSLHLDGYSYIVTAMILTVFGVCALLAALTNWSLTWRVRLALPQQFILVVQFVSIGLAVSLGVYPDGYIPVGRGIFIFFDQLPILALTTYHTFCIILAVRKLNDV